TGVQTCALPIYELDEVAQFRCTRILRRVHPEVPCALKLLGRRGAGRSTAEHLAIGSVVFPRVVAEDDGEVARVLMPPLEGRCLLLLALRHQVLEPVRPPHEFKSLRRDGCEFVTQGSPQREEAFHELAVALALGQFDRADYIRHQFTASTP